MRRKEFDNNDPQTTREVLGQSKIGHLAFLREDEIELLPYNFIYRGEYVYFHSSPKTGLARAVDQEIRFLAYDNIAWIPSTWRHPELACPATTYYASVSFCSRLEEVVEVPEKAEILEHFMAKYQGKEGYKPLADPAYVGPLKALFVGRLRVANPVTKLKMGQHLTEKQRTKVYENLRLRSLPGDREVAHQMKQANPDLASEDWVEDLNLAQLQSLTTVLSQTYWGKGRCVTDQARLNGQSGVLLAKCQGDKVLAFARVALLNTRSAYLADVVVHPEHRGQGLGTELMNRLMAHPKIQEVGRFMLVTKDCESLYEKFGFVAKYRTDTTFMVREPRPLYPRAVS